MNDRFIIAFQPHGVSVRRVDTCPFEAVEATNWLADTVDVVGKDDVFIFEESCHFVLNQSKVKGSSPAESTARNGQTAYFKFPPVVRDLADVLINAVSWNPNRWRGWTFKHQVRNIVLEVVHHNTDSVTEESEIKSHINASRGFPLQIGVSGLIKLDTSLVPVLSSCEDTNIWEITNLGVSYLSVATTNF